MSGVDEQLSFGDAKPPRPPNPDRRIFIRRLIAAIAVPLVFAAGLYYVVTSMARTEASPVSAGTSNPYNEWFKTYNDAFASLSTDLDHGADRAAFTTDCETFARVITAGERLPTTNSAEADQAFDRAIKASKSEAGQCEPAFVEGDEGAARLFKAYDKTAVTNFKSFATFTKSLS